MKSELIWTNHGGCADNRQCVTPAPGRLANGPTTKCDGSQTRTREHVLADLSANYVEKRALLCGFAVDHVRPDYGIDLTVRTFNRRGEAENGWIPFQLKGTDRLKAVDGGRAVTCRIERADLRHWLNEAQPVMLALYNARADLAYWLFVKGYFDALPRFDLNRTAGRISVRIPRNNVLDRQAMRALARLKNKIDATIRMRVRHAE